MKQHISPNQVLEITKEQFYSLFPNDQHSVDSLVNRKDYATLHNKKMTIGKMIELWLNKMSGNEEISFNDLTKMTKFITIQNQWEESFGEMEVVDALWQAVKEVYGFTEVEDA